MQNGLSDPVRLVSPNETRLMCGGLSTSTLRRLIAANAFPRPVILARDRHNKPVRIAFVYAELTAWCRDRVEAERGAA